MRPSTMATALALALAFSAGGAAAQEIPSPYRHIERAQSLGLTGGFLWTDRGEQELAPKSGPWLGLEYTGRFADPVAGVVRLWAVPTERPIYSRPVATDLEAPLVLVDETSATLVGAEAGLRLLVTGPRTWHSLAPFLEGTVALLSMAGSRIPEESNLPAEQIVDFGPSFAVGMGAGTDWFLTDRISVNVTGKSLIWRFTVPEGLSTTGSEDTEWLKNFGATIGLAVHF